jgi:hypothetical protein
MQRRKIPSLITTRVALVGTGLGVSIPGAVRIAAPTTAISTTPRRFPSAQTLDLYRVTNPPIKLHHLHPPPSAITPKGYLLPEFYSGATGLTGRFNEGFLLRRLQTTQLSVARGYNVGQTTIFWLTT